MRAKAYYARFSLRDLVPEVHEHIFRSGIVSLLPKPPAQSSQASLIIIHRPTEEMKTESTLPRPEIESRTCGIEARCSNYSATRLHLYAVYNKYFLAFRGIHVFLTHSL
ncbi:hypothetical protein TNCV_152261 [Trichonephila clavipes]|uniref:Uncharacterized protein n=1 Tax=Trichonephila clavipes TaxID=2585209 RepID=A0A8X6RN47_TRICX|nr:hypothetical protein TNCV_152261 [Trichonephila clavipes]